MNLRLLFSAVIVVAASAAVAEAGAVYGTSATSGNYGTNITQFTGSDSDMDGVQDGVGAGFRNNLVQSGAQTFTVDWDVTGAGNLIHWTVWVVGRTTAASVVGITLTDDASLTATSKAGITQSLASGVVAPTTITPFHLTNFHSHGDYNAAGGFNWSDVRGLQITFQLNNPITNTNRAVVRIDAVSNPEPGTLALFGIGVLGLGVLVRRKRRTVESA